LDLQTKKRLCYITSCRYERRRKTKQMKIRSLKTEHGKTRGQRLEKDAVVLRKKNKNKHFGV